MRLPDAAFVSKHRLAGREPLCGFVPFAPDLAVEIMSPNDSLADVRAKAREYLRAGTGAAWIVEPRRRRVHVLGPLGARVLGADDVLDGAEVLPGFAIRVARLFP